MQEPKPSMNREQLSQLMDGEWHELNPSECVQGICNDEALRETWARYHLVRDVLNKEPVRADTALFSRIRDAIAEEPTYSNITSIHTLASQPDEPVEENGPTTSVVATEGGSDRLPRGVAGEGAESDANSTWLRTGVAGFALAASVAMVTVLGMNVWRAQPVSETTLADNSDQSLNNGSQLPRVVGETVPQVDLVSNTGFYWVSPQSAERIPSGEEKLNLMLSRHIESSPTVALEGGLRYSRLIGYDEREEKR